MMVKLKTTENLCKSLFGAVEWMVVVTLCARSFGFDAVWPLSTLGLQVDLHDYIKTHIHLLCKS